jgi:hypothetical protein
MLYFSQNWFSMGKKKKNLINESDIMILNAKLLPIWQTFSKQKLKLSNSSVSTRSKTSPIKSINHKLVDWASVMLEAMELSQNPHSLEPTETQ